jgi:hypothetical protein
LIAIEKVTTAVPVRWLWLIRGALPTLPWKVFSFMAGLLSGGRRVVVTRLRLSARFGSGRGFRLVHPAL